MSAISRVTVDTGCQVCNAEYIDFVYDARMRVGMWAYMCEDCFNEYGIGLGLGKGQKYDTKTLQKVEG